MTPEHKSLLAELLSGAFDEMFASDRQPPSSMHEAKEGDQRPLLIVSVGFCGTGIKGALVMAAPVVFFRATYPLPPSAGGPSEDDLADWAGEAGNQLLGRVKNRLATRGLQFNVSSPTVVSGRRMQVEKSTRPEVVRCHAVRGGEKVSVLFEVERDDGQDLLAPNAAIAAASPEGESLLF